ncbi:hypothetical protein AMAG_10344 [Allomyces macrogynus ATCC 38327]|uniref:Orc1-like AAA ATPase domain-containing protein n=1 Tax=Allomyces macrogynus (strain ATCC 38327) TaxID=578462 RepID=A0A0L0SUT1_ALLM3|nr:hypothetical protein AMAG_10344 [Allomyces macrogynus ATCC 38327]|eukprot:KNE66084.1 hypothetical protein AMAG_10344 [Allomyces macrogynus ATCC 38327]
MPPRTAPPATLTLNEVAQKFPQRAEAIDELQNLLGDLDLPAPRVPIVVHGAASTGKTAVLTAAHAAYNVARPFHAAFVSCETAITPKLLLTKIIQQWTDSARPDRVAVPRADSLCGFVTAARVVIPSGAMARHVMIIDDADQLLGWGSEIIQFLLRVAELTCRPIVPILVTKSDWRQFTPLFPALVVEFPPYSKEEVCSILLESAPAADPVDDANGEGENEAVADPFPVYQLLAEMLFDTMRQCCNNLEEIRYVTNHVFALARTLIADGTVDVKYPHRVMNHVKDDVKHLTMQLYSGHSSAPMTSEKDDKLNLELPTTTKFLLIAAYLASYNPTTLDRHFFTKGRDTSQVKRRKVDASGKKVAGAGPVRQQLLGPKTFPLERMLAIFHSIADDQVENNMDIHHQVATLISLRYLTRVSAADAIDNYRCKCNVSFEIVQQIAKSLRFELSECLHDVHS